MPTTPPSRIDKAATDREMRVPTMMRLKISRPCRSVPRGYSLLPPSIKTGAMPRARRSESIALWGAITGARIATSTLSKTMAVGSFGARFKTARRLPQPLLAVTTTGLCSIVSMAIT